VEQENTAGGKWACFGVREPRTLDYPTVAYLEFYKEGQIEMPKASTARRRRRRGVWCGKGVSHPYMGWHLGMGLS